MSCHVQVFQTVVEHSRITAAVIEAAIQGMRTALGNDQETVTVQIRSGASFDSGFAAKEFAKLSGIELRPGDVIQED